MNNVIDVYKKAAKGKDFHLMSGNDSILKTRFVSNQIIKKINPKSEDTIIDVGCGDGTLVSMIGKNCTGLATTDIETERLRLEYPDLNFVTGLTDKLPFHNDSIDKLVCNSVLLLLDLDTIKKSLAEFHRVLKIGGGLAYIGEIPETQEFELEKSIIKRAIKRLRKDGITKLAKMVLEASKEKLTEGKFVRIESHYYSKPEDFINLAKGFGLDYKFHFRHITLDQKGKIIQTDRWNYVFRQSA